MLPSGGAAELHVVIDGQTDLAGQIYRQIRDAIRAGLLRTGDALPPTRELGQRLGVARNTVATAYERLTGEGYVRARTGAGTYVTDTYLASEPAVPPGALRPRPIWDTLPPPPTIRPWPYELRAGLPDVELFPYQAWRGALARVLRMSNDKLGVYSEPAGHPPLRDAIARHIGVSRGVRAAADDITVTSGMQQALDLLTRVLLDPGDLVAVEDPGYPPAFWQLRAAGMQVVGIPVDDDGLVVDAIPDGVRMVYVTPSHQYPLGAPLAPARRTELLAWADKHGGVIVEDDYDSEFRFTGRPLEPLHTLDRFGRVCYVGSFSKVLLPAVRLGFVIVPPSLRDALHKAKHAADWHTELPGQMALAEFMNDGRFAVHVRRMRNVYAERHAIVEQILWRDFDEWLRPITAVTGLHVSATSGVLAHERVWQIARDVKADGVAIMPIAYYSVADRPVSGLVIGYGNIRAEDIPIGLDLVRKRFEAAAVTPLT